MNQKELDEIKQVAEENKGFRTTWSNEKVLGLLAEIERLQAQLDAYRDYVRGKLTLGQLEAALNRIEPIYQQKPAPG